MNPTPLTITDTFGRTHDYLRISLTERCNLRCFYCMPEDGVKLRENSAYMTGEEVFGIAEIFKNLGVKKIRLTGGEPLVRNDARKIIRNLSKLGIEIAITTNGILVDKYLDVFKEAGIRSVNVSLDSLDREKLKSITRRDYFDRILSNINLLLENNFQVKINAVVIRGVNDNEVTGFIRWTQNKPLHVRFIEYMPFNGNKWDWSRGISFDDLMKKAHAEFGEKQTERIEDRKNDTSKNFRVRGYEGTFAIISSVTNPFCDTCNRIRLTADGKIKNCLFSGGETDLLTPYRNGENIIPLVQSSVLEKKFRRGGMDTFEMLSDPRLNHNNRSMVRIGG